MNMQIARARKNIVILGDLTSTQVDLLVNTVRSSGEYNCFISIVH